MMFEVFVNLPEELDGFGEIGWLFGGWVWCLGGLLFLRVSLYDCLSRVLL